MNDRDPQTVVSAVEALLPGLRERAGEAEAARRVPTENIKELQEAGFFRLLQPSRWNGFEADPEVFFDTVRKIGSACGSTGWVSSIIGVHNWHMALFSEEAQNDVWGKDTDVRISSSYAPMGAGQVVDGGYIVNGAWQWSSGCDHADWAVLGGPVIKDGRPVDFVSFLIPREDYRIDDVWRVVGLRGTGSNTVVVEDAFVPRHRALSFRDMSQLTAPGLEKNTAPVYKMPWGSMHPTTISAPIVGMAYGAYDAHVEHQGKRVRAAFAGEKGKDDPFAKVRLAEAASDIDAAWRQLAGNIREEYEIVSRGDEVSMDLRLRTRRDQVRATGRAVASIDLLFESAGATALEDHAPLQRFWRDAHAGRVHAANDPERAYTMFGSGEFGLPITDTMV
ncbi:MAG: 3-hydroxy-9,10-secoandrosta-1,3,5(10)-triene-9,17-dione monooxygenase oxygenase subunit [Rhodococcus sp. (in: high G+C Gram-positive bacteria)]